MTVDLEMEYNTHRMLADSTARAILDLSEMDTRKLLFLLAEGAVAKGTRLRVTLVDDETSSPSP